MRTRRWMRVKQMVWFVCAVAYAIAGAGHADEPRSRQLELSAHLRVHSLPAGKQVRVWLPQPQPSAVQRVQSTVTIADVELRPTVDRHYGNRMLFGSGVVDQTGMMEFEVVWRVVRQEVRETDSYSVAAMSDRSRSLWLTGTRRVPIGGRPLDLIEVDGLPDQPRERARHFYQRVLDHMRYDKSQPGYGTGDAVWACDSRFGNCTDFHSLFNSLARSFDIPARFEIGYPLPSDRNEGAIRGYHCWAWFHVDGRGWTPVDISEADQHPERQAYCFGNLSVDRVAFSVGREITLEPPQQGPPLNYFVKPYAEVDGQPVNAQSVDFSVAFRDIDGAAVRQPVE